MKKVGSALKAPFRLIARLLRRLLRSLRVLGRPLVRLSRLRGRKLAAALAAIVAVVVVAVLVLRPGPSPEEQVRETLERFAEATRDKDYQTLCDDLYATDLVNRIRSAGLPCEVALQTGLENRQNPQLEVLSVEVTGDVAAARVRSTAVGEVPSVDTVRLVKEDEDWRVASLSEPGGAGPAP